ncbi:hypothetical protein INS49_006747 [Diaporthe citri]|uniref:uncharacterized protein n=1 Tax=Diaporthe citri TaxID=83186 RepID=UPI001C7FC5C4|nr:uncharacterized protein INS49_006747 [Diaporthe citri]KAG6365140.1 hypothetical protein INS49_006747 [Diaporthe citri]
MHALISLLAALALLATSADAKAKPRDAILLSQVESLTLRADRQTSHRRVPAVPQLKCVSSKGICSKYQIDVLRCENKGSGYDSEDIQWSCTASLPPELKLGSTDVICEGYASPDDPYVLKGSCAVEYRMALTREGEEKWPDLGGGGGGYGSDGGAGLVGWVFWVIFFSVLAFIVYNAFVNAQRGGGNGPRPRQNNGGGYWGGGGGGGGGDDFGNDDPPPPYPGTNNSGKPRRSGGSSTQRGNNAQQGWRPDFWSAAGGAAAGAAAAYGAGRMGRNNNNNTRGNGVGYGGGNYGSTWGSGGGSPSRSGSSGSSSGSGVSSSRHESTGFGSTSRR